jgi:PKD repeat protein
METTTRMRRARRQPPAARARLSAAVVLLAALGALVAPGAAFAGSVSITPASPTIFKNASVTFTATEQLDAGESSPSYQWYVNGVAAGTEQSQGTGPWGGSGSVRVVMTYTRLIPDPADPLNVIPSTQTAEATAPVTVQNRPPTASITGPASLLVGQPGQLTGGGSDPDGDPLSSFSWQVDGAPFSIAQNPVVTFSTTGSHTVTLVTGDGSLSSAPDTHTINVPNRRPDAQFEIGSNPATVGQLVTLNAATSVDPDGEGLQYSWNLGNGTGYGPFQDEPNAAVTFMQPGNYPVGVIVRDKGAGTLEDEITKVVTVVNGRPPTVGFSYTPATPAANGVVTFTATGANADGSASAYAWDLDNDGVFDDASGVSAARSFPAGNHVVSVKATDPGSGLSQVAIQTVSVRGTDGTIQGGGGGGNIITPPVVVTLRPMTPAPKIRLGYAVIGRVTRVMSLTIRGPKDAVVRVRCRGKGCPTKKVLRAKITKTGKPVRFKRFERRMRAGTILQIYITKQGRWGEYRKIRFRANKRAVWTDRCIKDFGAKVQRCPAD